MPPNDPRFLALEPWEIELEYLTWDAYEADIARAQGKEQYVEEVEIDENEFKQQVSEFNRQTSVPTNEWEVVDGQEQ